MFDIENFKNSVLEHITDNRNLFPSLLNNDEILAISIYYEECIANDYNDKLEIICGKSFKDDDSVRTFNSRVMSTATCAAISTAKCVAKKYDILINIKNIRASLSNIKKGYGVDIDENIAIKSNIIHELVHSVSRGYVNEYIVDSTKDEAYTDYFAKEIFDGLNCGDQYFSNYQYPFDSKRVQEIYQYIEGLKDITENERNLYFKGTKST